MTRAEFLKFLHRSVADEFMTEDEAADLLVRFERGEINESVLPLTVAASIDELDEEDMQAALDELSGEKKRHGVLPLIVLSAFAVRAKARERLQDKFRDDSAVLAKKLVETGNTAEFQSAMKSLVKVHTVQQALVGAGRELDANEINQLSDEIVQDLAYLARWSDEIAARNLLGREFSGPAAEARAKLYAGRGRAQWFKFALAEEEGLVDFVALDDDNTCQECLDADRNGPYQASDPSIPLPGDVCRGGGNCRCELVPR